MAPDGSGFGGFAGPVAEEAAENRLRTGGAADGEDVPGIHALDERVAALEEIERVIVTAAARVAVATHSLLTALRSFDEQRGWELHERKSAADWLSWRIGMSLGTAREHVRVARALGYLPHIDEALRTARISFSKARALTRVATPENESELLVTARCATAHQLEQACRKFRHVAYEQVEGRPRASVARRRTVRFRLLDDGWTEVAFTVPPEEAAEIRANLDGEVERARLLAGAARASATASSDPSEGLPAAGSSISPSSPGGSQESIPSGQHEEPREETPLPAGESEGAWDAEPPPRPKQELAPYEVEQRATFNRVDALLSILRAWRHSQPPASGRRPRCEFHVQVSLETLSDRGKEPALLDDGTALSPETARRLSCDTAIVPFAKDEEGNIVAVGKRSRTVPASIARALRMRDRHCRFPGCTSTLWLDAHHVVHWAKGGPTDAANLVRLCSFHHWCMHEGGCTAAMEKGRLVFRDPRGKVIENAPPLAPDGMPGPELLAWLTEHRPNHEEMLPIPIGGPADWSLFVCGMLFRTYGPPDGRPIEPRLPLPDGTAPWAQPPERSRPPLQYLPVPAPSPP